MSTFFSTQKIFIDTKNLLILTVKRGEKNKEQSHDHTECIVFGFIQFILIVMRNRIGYTGAFK